MWLKFPALKGPPSSRGLVATLGNFDGVHLGHQSLLTEVRKVAEAQDLSTALITFWPHPSKVIRGVAPRRISRMRQVCERLREQSISNVIILRFNKALSQLEPEDFVDKILIDKLNVKHLVIGPFARIGKDRKGTSEWIQNYFENKGLSSSIVDPYIKNGKRVSSNSIRESIIAADLSQAQELMGRAFSISNRVVRGDQRGNKIGFPTANLKIANYVKPPYGVYLAKAVLNSVSYYALVNWGIRPTFDGAEESFEAHLLDYHGPSFYGQRLEVFLLDKIREEIKFNSIIELKAQILADIVNARKKIEQKQI